MAVPTPQLKYFGSTTIKGMDGLTRSTGDISNGIFRPTRSIFNFHFTHGNEYCTLSFMDILLDRTFVDLYQSSVFVRTQYLPRILVCEIKRMQNIERRNVSYPLNNIAAARTIEGYFYCIIVRQMRRRVEILL